MWVPREAVFGVCADGAVVLKETVRGQGVWRIRRRDRSSIIEMEKYEETGTGSILSDDFLRWRSQPLPDDNSQVQQT